MKKKITQLSSDLFKSKIQIEKELQNGNKTNEDLYQLIVKAIDFLKSGRKGQPISKKLPMYIYFEKEYGVTNLFRIELSKSARGFYTLTSENDFEILQIILEVHKTHKEYDRKGKY
jgi:hypothetical protein